ncbi:enoyl-CoA hydratase-related protein [Thiomonas bhubaneswarensis]|uniref:Enoyl-CoA hydratase/carnithine racemase n=1 Tax=Thiomonas bhubaneswarensis TaxID=339866 RepID=A0A0K6HU63_9BURK|nr:enoyl-CoA hydratase-related protein [Thiomonas bhubaneswarensis]CUA94439.1 Enoyl-CoA hydratase/carnithine racemase [Thiomonas bhubaneswarensis]
MSAELRAERQGDSLVLSLHHPETRHALTAALCAAALEALTTAQRDTDIRAVVLTGTAPHFCSGLHDLDALEALHDCILALRDCEPLIVGAVEGLARGAGAALALACDLLVLAEDAQVQLIDPLLPNRDVGGAQWLAAQLLPRPVCNEAALPGLGLGAARLHQLGVANRLCPPGLSVQTALRLIDGIGHTPNAPRKNLPNPRNADGDLHRHLSAQHHTVTRD